MKTLKNVVKGTKKILFQLKNVVKETKFLSAMLSLSLLGIASVFVISPNTFPIVLTAWVGLANLTLAYILTFFNIGLFLEIKAPKNLYFLIIIITTSYLVGVGTGIIPANFYPLHSILFCVPGVFLALIHSKISGIREREIRGFERLKENLGI